MAGGELTKQGNNILQGYFRVTITSEEQSRLDTVANQTSQEENSLEDNINQPTGSLIDLGQNATGVIGTAGNSLRPANQLNSNRQTQIEDGGLDIPISKSLFAFSSEQRENIDEDGVAIENRALEQNQFIFDQRRGEILGRPLVILSTRLHNCAEFIINDPTGDIYRQIKDFMRVEVEIGFDQGRRFKKFEGVIAWIGRRLPEGTIVRALDIGAKLQNINTPGVENNGVALDSKTITDTENLANDLENSRFNLDFDLGDYLNSNIVNEFPLSANLFNNADLVRQENAGSDYFQIPTATLEDALPGTDTFSQDLLFPDPVAKQEQTINLLKGLTELNSLGKTQDSIVQQIYKSILKRPIEDISDVKLDKQGEVFFGQSLMEKAVEEATLQGEVITTDVHGKTKKNLPGQGEKTNIILDYNELRDAFKFHPKITKRSAYNNRSGYTSVSIQGWDIRNKGKRGAVIVAGDDGLPAGNGVMDVPEWGEVKVSDPIFSGCIYTWGDATKNGRRVPTREVMEKIIAIAQIIQKFTDQTVGPGKKWTITSWYRDPASNRAANGSTKSQHLTGNAVDAIFPGCFAFHDNLAGSWEGGLAKNPGSFIHIDNRGHRARWTY